MKFTPLISSLFLSLVLLPQAAQADISFPDAQQKLKLIGKLLQDRGIQETFTILNDDSGQANGSPGARDQVDASDVQLLLSDNAHVVCVENDTVVVDTLHPQQINDKILNLSEAKDDKGTKPYSTIINELKKAPNKAILVKTTKIAADIDDATTHKPLETTKNILAADSEWLLGKKYQSSSVSGRKKFFCSIHGVNVN